MFLMRAIFWLWSIWLPEGLQRDPERCIFFVVFFQRSEWKPMNLSLNHACMVGFNARDEQKFLVSADVAAGWSAYSSGKTRKILHWFSCLSLCFHCFSWLSCVLIFLLGCLCVSLLLRACLCVFHGFRGCLCVFVGFRIVILRMIWQSIKGRRHF